MRPVLHLERYGRIHKGTWLVLRQCLTLNSVTPEGAIEQ